MSDEEQPRRVVCAVEGTRLARARSTGNWVHVDLIPEGVPDHDPEPISAAQFELKSARYGSLHDAAVDMLRHHDTLHPGSDCEWARRLWEALR